MSPLYLSIVTLSATDAAEALVKATAVIEKAVITESITATILVLTFVFAIVVSVLVVVVVVV